MAVSPREPSSATRGRGLAWGSFIAGLVFPLTYLFVVSEVVIRNVVPAGTSPFIGSLYTVFDYFEWPFPLLAIVLGLLLGYITLLTFVGIALALTISSWLAIH